jgi:hypothetical protein
MGGRDAHGGVVPATRRRVTGIRLPPRLAGFDGAAAAREREKAHLLESRCFVLEEGLIRQVGEGGSAPQRERLAQQPGGLLEASVL